MGVTNTRGYPFPDDDDESDVPTDMQQLADAVDRDVAGLTYDTGWTDVQFVNNFTAGFEGARYRRKADVVYVQVMAVSAAEGRATWQSEAVLFRLPVDMRPRYNHWISAINESRTVEVRVMSNGDLRLITPSRDDHGGVLVFSGSFPLN
jgi:hypothetical protein